MTCKPCIDAGIPNSLAYEGEGDVKTIRDLDLYIAGPLSSKKAIVVFYDIFGFGRPPKNGNVRRFCDKLASEGFLVAMPDFFRGHEWDIAKFPPQPEEFAAWKDTIASRKVVEKDIEELVLPFLSGTDAVSYGAIGFCWGGHQSILYSNSQKPFNACASIHGAFLTPDLLRQIEVPVMLLPSGTDPPLDPLIEAAKSTRVFEKCIFHCFKDEIHGFCAARGDWDVPSTKIAVHSVFEKTIDFFTNNL